MSTIEFVTVTYKDDFRNLIGLLESMDKNIKLDYVHTIILNDDYKHYQLLMEICKKFHTRIRNVLHYSQVGSFENDKKNYKITSGIITGWSLAQLLFFYYSEICKTDYYIILTCRNRIKKFWDIDNIIVDNKYPRAVAQQKWDDLSPKFQNYFETSYNYFNINYNEFTLNSNLPATNPPYIWKTNFVLELLSFAKSQNKNMFNYIDPCFNWNTGSDSYIYDAWLKFKNQNNSTYISIFHDIIEESR